MAGSVVLLADDDASIRLVVSQTLSADGHAVRATTNPQALMRWVKNGEGDCLVTDVYMGDDCIFDFLPDIKRERPDLPVIVISGQSTLMTANSAADGGAFDYLPKPFDIDDLSAKVKSALAFAPGERGLRTKDRQAERDERLPLIGRSKTMQDVFRVVSRVKNTDLTVLVEGESGTGKELAASAIHTLGNRADHPFVAMNLASVPSDGIAAELFGSVKPDGTIIPGKAGLADQGTLFLDEIGDMPPAAQTQLLRFLQNGEYTPLGASSSLRSNARVIASTKENLRKKIEDGAFREDLFFRLNVVTFVMPPLRSRTEDIPDLARAFLVRAEREGLPRKTLSERAINRLKDYPWPGNVRELENLIQRLSVLETGREISEDLVIREMQNSIKRPAVATGTFDTELEDLLERHIAPLLMEAANRPRRAGTEEDEDAEEMGHIYQSVLTSLEKPLIRQALLATRGNKVKAAALLGLNRNTLRSKINAHDISA